MTYFTDSPYERMMTQKPKEQRGNHPPASVSTKCKGCHYRQPSCVGGCIKKVTQPNSKKEGKFL